MTIDERIAEAEREIDEALADVYHAQADMRDIRRARMSPAWSRVIGWRKELARLRALKSGDAAEGER